VGAWVIRHVFQAGLDNTARSCILIVIDGNNASML